MVFNPPHRVVRYINVELAFPAPDRCRVTVQLRRDSGEVYVGTAEGASTPEDTRRSAALAALDAAHQAAGRKAGELELVGVHAADVLGRRSVFVVLRPSDPAQGGAVLGSCLVDQDTSRATALAVLNACNRNLGIG
jgi:hypothetical protein